MVKNINMKGPFFSMPKSLSQFRLPSDEKKSFKNKNSKAIQL